MAFIFKIGQSVTHPTRVTEQPNRILRWWIRHYRHAGLASMAGSAILACVIAVILLPVAFRNPAKGLSGTNQN